jgi:dTDP-4-dehydrorhamnose 3,5-epimerase
MKATETMLRGAFVLEAEPHTDERGVFSRAFCAREFVERGLEPTVVQANLSLTYQQGALRGLHFQYPPFAETKLVRCLRGAVLDVIVDLRPESPTFLQYVSVELSADNRKSVYVPRRFAHGFQVLAGESELLYLMGEFYEAEHQGGLRYDDPRLAIAWPHPVRDVSARDRAFPLLSACESDLRTRMQPAAD